MVRRWTRASSKFSSLSLLVDHYETLRDHETGRARLRDYAVFVGIPAALGGLVWLRGAHAAHVPEVLAAVAILTGLIFNVFVLLFDLTMRATDRTDPAYLDTVTRLVDELRANISYAVLLGLVLTSLLGGLALFTDTSQALTTPVSALVVALASQMLLTVSMILKRIRALYRAFKRVGPERIP
ncbi:hypothetical protein [Amycolatopsis sp. FDAARGOS 1241]|uniref:hypothetical protein n=1 Tax=Amycolatopsis sp. FDAARGOS 1241 TaxID=2778070 RepID=UPI0019505E4A|nr:hypothetical protein [Amycolatopsis sp. FDAARGOS 1241]QRP45772.1 hypothetical protein I6J71_42935 [Amycolatopsis sp. FDAARGOS 1241]